MVLGVFCSSNSGEFYMYLMDIERSLFDAELKLSELAQNQLSSTIELYRALGGGWN